MLHTIFKTEINHDQTDSIESIIFGAGCFWGVERKFWSLPGVVMTSVGYAGGDHPNPTYQLVCSGVTGHAEVVKIDYDPSKISLLDLLKVFWEEHCLSVSSNSRPNKTPFHRTCRFRMPAALSFLPFDSPDEGLFKQR